VFISELGGRDLVLVDAVARKELKRIALGGGAAGILMQPDGSRAYVAIGSENGVTVVDLKTPEPAGRIETGPGPDGLGPLRTNSRRERSGQRPPVVPAVLDCLGAG